ncbi:MAG: VOC family protein [Methylobacter sp.]
MTNAIKFIPEGYHTATPYLVITNAAKAIEFYKQAFGATELMRLEGPGDKIVHAEIRIGDSSIMLADEYPDFNALSPQTIGGSAVSIMLYVEDVDEVVDRAVAAGARLIMPVKDQFYGDRSGKIIDPFGHHWMIATHKEDVSPEEIRQRADALFGMF